MPESINQLAGRTVYRIVDVGGEFDFREMEFVSASGTGAHCSDGGMPVYLPISQVILSREAAKEIAVSRTVAAMEAREAVVAHLEALAEAPCVTTLADLVQAVRDTPVPSPEAPSTSASEQAEAALNAYLAADNGEI